MIHATAHAVERAWCILRCANCKTLDLAASLNEAGFEAWTPVEVQRRLKQEPRKLLGGKLAEARVPMTPSFVFAPAEHMQDLLNLSHSPALNYQVWDRDQRRMVTRGHPYFRVFQHFGECAVISGAQLEPLRSIERKRKPRGTVKAIPPGTAVRLSEGGFAGMNGIVVSVRSKHATVEFVGFPVPVDVPCWLLSEMVDEQAAVNVNRPASEHAARAA